MKLHAISCAILWTFFLIISSERGTQSKEREDTRIDTAALLSDATDTWLEKLDEIERDAQIKKYLMTEISKIKKKIPAPTSNIQLDWNDISLVQLMDQSSVGSDYNGNFRSNARYGTASAIQRQTTNSGPFLLTGSLPKKVWYKFSQPMVIAQFGFRNRRDSGLRQNDPINFNFIGSSNCRDWTTIMTVEGVQWTSNDEEKTWTITNEDSRSLMVDSEFSCYGIEIQTISGSNMAAIQDLKMWQVRRITGTQSEKREDTLIDTEALLSNATNTWLRKLDEIKSDARIKNYLMTEISKIKKRIPECQYEVKKIERLSWLAKSFNYTFPSAFKETPKVILAVTANWSGLPDGLSRNLNVEIRYISNTDVTIIAEGYGSQVASSYAYIRVSYLACNNLF